MHYRLRQVQKGKHQYQPHAVIKPTAVLEQKRQQAENLFAIREGVLQFYVNLDHYLDSGLFLDHRFLRRQIMQQSANCDVLNLFCYTASISLAAAIGGASSTLSIDLSKRYLTWGMQNFKLNAFEAMLYHRNIDTGDHPQQHQLLRCDCIQWLQQQSLSNNSSQFDLIILDPPTFSNSKAMAQSLDVQRDHQELIRLTMSLLRRGGSLYFSTHRRQFKLERALLDDYLIEDITTQSIDKDFQRSPKGRNIHRLWVIKYRN